MSDSIKHLDLSKSHWPVFVSKLATNKPRQTALHAHEEAQLLYCEHGVIWTETADTINLIPPLRGIWWPSQLPHAAKSLQSILASSAYVKPELCPDSLKDKSHCLYVGPLLREMLRYASDFDYALEPAPSQTRFLIAMIDQIAEQTIDDNKLQRAKDERLQRAQDFLLKADLEVDMSLEFVAKHAFLSGRQLNRLIRQQFQVSFTKWRRDLMIYRSILLLERTPSITDVAYETGFDSPSSFARAFKRIKGMSPTDYQQSFMKGKI